MLNLKQINKITDVCIITIAFILIFEILFYHSAVTNKLIQIVENAGTLGWVVLCVLQFLQVVIIPVPATFITLASIKMYQNQLLTLYIVTICVIILGVIVTYLIGRKWGKKAVMWCAGSEEDYQKWLSVLKSKKTNVFYLATVIFPIFPDDVLCLMAGSIKMNFWWYLFCNVVGRSIGLATFIFVFNTVSNSIATIIIMMAIIIVLVVFKIIIKRRLNRESCGDR